MLIRGLPVVHEEDATVKNLIVDNFLFIPASVMCVMKHVHNFLNCDTAPCTANIVVIARA